MNSRRTIGSILALALLVGQTFVPLARASCAIPKARTSACPSCSAGPSAATPSIAVDRSCCAAPNSLTDRDPATVAPDRVSAFGDDRPLAAAVILPAARVLVAMLPARSPDFASDPPGSAPPLLRTTILLI